MLEKEIPCGILMHKVYSKWLLGEGNDSQGSSSSLLLVAHTTHRYFCSCRSPALWPSEEKHVSSEAGEQPGIKGTGIVMKQ